MRKQNIGVTVLTLVTLACICSQGNGPTDPPPPPPETELPPANVPVPNFYNETEVDGSRGTSQGGLPVLCPPEDVEGSVNIPANSFNGTETVSIECLDPGGSQAQYLDELVRQKTGSTSEVLGAINMNPSPFDFKKDVTLVIPLFRQRQDLAGQTTRVYFFAPERPNDLDYVDDATISSDGWRATATHVRHFSTFVVVHIPPQAGFECTDPLGCVEISPGEPIRIGYILSMSGPVSYLGVDSLNGIEIALEDRKWEILGHPFELVGEDSMCSREGGANAAKRMSINQDIVGIIGTNCSSAAISALPYISESGLVMVSPSNTSPALTDPSQNWMPGYYRTAPNDIYQGYLAAEFALEYLGLFRAATINDSSPYSESLAEAFASRFEEMGGTIVGRPAVNIGDTDMRALLTAIGDEGIEVIFMPLFEPEGNYILAQSEEISGLEETVFIGTDGLFIESFPGNTGSAAVGTFIVGPYLSGSRYEKFLSTYSAMYGNQPSTVYAAHAYDATSLLLDAIIKVAVSGNDGSVYIGRQAMRDALTARRNFAGVTGTINCSKYGDCASGTVYGVYEITNDILIGYDDWPPPLEYVP